MTKMTFSHRISTALMLAGLAYLGFYVFGLVMGVYAPGDVPYLTIPAGVIAAASVAYLISSRRDGAVESEQFESRHQRERRGF
jgi:hypothetical protein